jgi:hypothetical protein
MAMGPVNSFLILSDVVFNVLYDSCPPGHSALDLLMETLAHPRRICPTEINHTWFAYLAPRSADSKSYTLLPITEATAEFLGQRHAMSGC